VSAIAIFATMMFYTRKEEKKSIPTIDPLGSIIDYVEKDAKAFAKDPIGGLGRAAYNLVGKPFVAGSEVADSQVADSSSSPIAPSVIFGFTDKPQYDAFLQGDTKHLTPYPLVKRFLMDQLDQVEHRTGSKLLVLDALDAPQVKPEAG
jgi:hypothetical protein